MRPRPRRASLRSGRRQLPDLLRQGRLAQHRVTLSGANHMSFIDDVASCGFTCSVCKPATMPSADALAISRSYTVAFFARYLRGQTGYDAWLTGELAKKQWIDGASSRCSRSDPHQKLQLFLVGLHQLLGLGQALGVGGDAEPNHAGVRQEAQPDTDVPDTGAHTSISESALPARWISTGGPARW